MSRCLRGHFGRGARIQEADDRRGGNAHIDEPCGPLCRPSRRRRRVLWDVPGMEESLEFGGRSTEGARGDGQVGGNELRNVERRREIGLRPVQRRMGLNWTGLETRGGRPWRPSQVIAAAPASRRLLN